MVKVSVDFNFLTSKQKKVYSAIETYIRSRGIPPTVREIGELVGEKTPGAVQGILNRLEQKGVIKREVGMARSIQLVAESTNYLAPVYVPELKKVTLRNIDDMFSIYNIKKYHPFSPEFLQEQDHSFMINCPDNSLTGKGIRYEDMLLISNTPAKNGDIVLLVYEGHALLREYHGRRNEGEWILKADSNLLGKEVFRKDEIVVLGKVMGKWTKM
jgi:repressor LexA